MRKLKNIVFTLLCICLLSFCKRANTTWDDNIVAPLATGNLTLGNLFPDTVIKVNADSSLKIAFTSNLINYGLDSLLKIPDTTITTAITNTIVAYAFQPGEQPFQAITTENTYNFPNGIQLKKATIRQGKAKIELINTVDQPLVYNFTLSSATKNGVTLNAIYTVPKAINSSTPGDTIVYLDLSGYDIDFTGNSPHNKTNTIEQIGGVSIAPTAQPDTWYLNQGLTANFTFTGMVPQYALGYFGSQSIVVGPDTTAFTAFSAIKQGMLNLNSANVTLTIKNQFGVNMSALLSNILSINTNIPNTVSLTATPLNSAVHISSATNTGFGATATTAVITLNNSNSNVKDFIGNLPGKLGYKLNASINPSYLPLNPSGSNDFGYYGTHFSADLAMDVPLY
ncbi:MAG: hypothetical protein ABI388_10350, partial [Bacteroidia bacterium]